MRETLSFAAWLTAAPASWFARIARTRADLLRTDAADVRRFATLASSRAAAAAGLELLDAAALRIVHRAAVRSRISAAVPRDELLPGPADEAALAAAITTGLLWPAQDGTAVPRTDVSAQAQEPARDSAQDPAEDWPLTAPAYRVHPEAAELLPVTAAARADPLPWDEARDPRPLTTHRIPAALLLNAQAAGTAGASTRTLAAAGEFARHEVSQLVSGGVGKRDAQNLARAVGLSQERFTLSAELAAHLGWLSITQDPADPQWKPTPEFDLAVAAPREEVWGQLARAWLRYPVDVVHVLAGATPAGERVHLLGRDDHFRTAFSGFPVSHPQILLLRRLVLATLLRMEEFSGAEEASASAGTAVEEDGLLALLVFEHPLLAVLTTDELAEVLDEAESFGLTASPLGMSRAHALTPLGRSLARWVRDREGTGQALAAGSLPASLIQQVAALLPPLETTVTLQSDLTAVASGPLDHRVQARLEALAQIDTRGQGTVFRITDDTLAAALRAGRSAESVLSDLAELSSTGVPSTLRHMVESQASRLHRVRVAGARSVIVVDDPADLDVIFDDPASTATAMRRLSATVAISEAHPDRVTALVETEDRPVLRADTEARAARPDRAPTPVLPSPPVTRTTRVPADAVDAHIAVLEGSRARGGGRAAATARTAQAARGAEPRARSGNATGPGPVEAGAGPDTVLAELGEAAAVRAAVELVVAASDGTRRLIRMVPEAVRAGRLLGRTDTGSAVRIAAARIVEVRRV